jgi:UDP-N-acetyl-D-galactosamine dehydrogenase
LNISFVNELALLFHKLGIDTHEVLEAAKTKWNFLAFKPGLVGGHCIGVDPYYLVHRAQEKGYQPNVILSGRSINNKMGDFVAHRVLNLLSQRGIKAQQAKIDVLGLAFKANCPDTRNSKVFDVIATLAQHGCSLSIWDPWVREAPIVLNSKLREDADLILLAVAHDEFLSLDWKQINDRSLVFDVTGTIPKSCISDRL